MLLQSLRRWLKVVLWELEATSAEYTSGVPHGDGLPPTENISYHWSFVFLSRPHFGATFRKIQRWTVLYFCLLIVYLYWKFCSFCCTFLYLNSQPELAFYNQFSKAWSLPKENVYSRVCLIFQQHTRVLRLIPQSLVQPFFHSSPFFGQRKLNTDEPTEQKEHIKFHTLLSQDLLCICSILPYKLSYTCRVRCWLR